MKLILVFLTTIAALTLSGSSSAHFSDNCTHSTVYRSINGVNYAERYVHQHTNPHRHHLTVYKQAPGGYYIQIDGHFHHRQCAH